MLLNFIFLLFLPLLFALNPSPEDLESLVESLYTMAEGYSFEYKNLPQQELTLIKGLQRDIIKYALLGQAKAMETSSLHEYDVEEFANEFKQLFKEKEAEFKEKGYDEEKAMETLIRTLLVCLEDEYLKGSVEEKKAILLNIIGDTLFNLERVEL